MAYFDRYRTDLKWIDLAWKGGNPHTYCNPKDYGCSIEECEEYVKKLNDAQETNKQYKKDKMEFYRTILICMCSVLAIIPIVIIYYLSNWNFIILWCICAGFWGITLYFFIFFDEKIGMKDYTRQDFFPPIDNKVEMLLNDYLKKESEYTHKLLYG